MENSRELVLDELTRALRSIDQEQFKVFLDQLLSPGYVLVTGVGRVLLSMKVWVKRLYHLGVDINYVGSETEKPVGEGDLLIAASSSGESLFPVNIAKLAVQKGARVAYIGCTEDSTIAKLSDFSLLLAGRTKFANEGEFISSQPMSTLFEQQLYLLCDIITLEIMRKHGWDEDVIKERHANLE